MDESLATVGSISNGWTLSSPSPDPDHGDAIVLCSLEPRVARVATVAAASRLVRLPAAHDAGDAHGRVRGGGAAAGVQGPRPAADVGGLLSWPVGPAALHGGPPARPSTDPGAGVRFPAAGPGGRRRRAGGAVAERDSRSGSEENAAEDPGPAVLARRALLRRGRRGRRRQVQRAVADRPDRRGARLPGLHQWAGRGPDR